MTTFARLVAALALITLLAPAAAGAGPFPAVLVDFGPASAAPLFTGGGPNAWDRDLRERGWIMRHGGCWHLWYTGSNPDRDPVRRLGHATSPDGLNWTRSSSGPLVADRWIEDVCVVKSRSRSGELLRMVAEGEDDVAHLLVSRNGVEWRSCGSLDIRLVSGEPIPPGPRGTPTVWLERGVWHLFYERRDDGVWLATSRDLRTFTNVSDDLVHWTKYTGNPILPADDAHPKRSSGTLIFDGERHRLYTTHPDVRVRFAVSRRPSR